MPMSTEPLRSRKRPRFSLLAGPIDRAFEIALSKKTELRHGRARTIDQLQDVSRVHPAPTVNWMGGPMDDRSNNGFAPHLKPNDIGDTGTPL